MKALKEEMPHIPEYLHLRNRGGSITSKHILDSTWRERKQFIRQAKFEAKLYIARAEERGRLAKQEERGEVAVGTAAQYFAVTKPLDDEFELLYSDFAPTLRGNRS